MKRFRRFGVLALCIAGLMAGAGCQSTRVLTDLKPEQNPELSAPAGTFYIAELNYSNPVQYTEKAQREILAVLRRESVQAYPKLFTENPSGAIPLSVGISYETDTHDFKNMVWMFGTLLTMLPCPFHMDYEYKTSVKVWTEGSGLLVPELSKPFRNEMHQWVSLFSPLALIPVPGETDVPKVSGSLFNISRLEKLYYEGFARQVATATAQLVTKADPGFWTAQPQRSAPAVLQPSGASAPAGALVLPTETVAPF